MKKYWHLWRKYAAPPLLGVHIISLAFPYVYPFIVLLWLTVPCGIPLVNKKWYLWYPRQGLFLFFGVAEFIKVYL